MSYTVRAKVKGFAESAAKQERCPQVMEALRQRFGWRAQPSGQSQLRLSIPVNLEAGIKQAMSATFDMKTGEFVYDSDYEEAQQVVSDSYEAVDIGIAYQKSHNIGWHWTGESAIEIEESEFA